MLGIRLFDYLQWAKKPIVLFDYLFARSADFFLMKILEILELEQNNTSVILHKEGLFWRVYEHSAYLFAKYIKEYNLTKKFYKNVKQEVVYLGFPQNSVSKIENICKEKGFLFQKEDKHIKITGLKDFVAKEFVKWKTKIPLYIVGTSISCADTSEVTIENTLIERIKSFNLVNKTPIECQSFIVELQTEING